MSKVTKRLTTAVNKSRWRGQLMGVGGKKRPFPMRRISHRRGKRSKKGALSGVRKRMNGKRKSRISHSNREIWRQMGWRTVIDFF
jgi:phage gp16-like protein